MTRDVLKRSAMKDKQQILKLYDILKDIITEWLCYVIITFVFCILERIKDILMVIRSDLVLALFIWYSFSLKVIISKCKCFISYTWLSFW